MYTSIQKKTNDFFFVGRFLPRFFPSRWGLISDTDIEADDMRFVGAIRTTIKGTWTPCAANALQQSATALEHAAPCFSQGPE